MPQGRRRQGNQSGQSSKLLREAKALSGTASAVGGPGQPTPGHPFLARSNSGGGCWLLFCPGVTVAYPSFV